MLKELTRSVLAATAVMSTTEMRVPLAYAEPGVLVPPTAVPFYTT